MTVRRDALRLGLVASAAALFGRGTARAADALTIEPDGATIFAKRINFGSRYGEFLAFWSPLSVGVQDNTLYQRSTLNFAWYNNGKHSDTQLDPGEGGTKMMSLTDGTLTVSDKFVSMGAATLKNSLMVEGDATLKKSLTVEGDTTLTGTLKGPIKIDGANTLEFGAGVSGKQGDAGKIGYQTFGSGALDIVGAGTDGSNRKIKFWAEGGATFSGSLNVSGNLSVPGGEEPLRMLRGIVNSDGTKFGGGEGFTVKSVAANRGLYDITFTPGFPSIPAASATQIFGQAYTLNAPATSEGGDTRDNAVIAHLSADRMRVKTGGSNGGESNRVFSFIVIGPR
jgi:cytoskeletal protein CcmA (bactofilin family)